MFNFLLGAALGLANIATATATEPVIEQIIATRSADLHSTALRDQLKVLAKFDRRARAHVTDVSPKAPITGRGHSVLNLVRERVLANPTKRSQTVELVINGHGSPGAIHSQFCEPITFASFARDWRGLMAELVAKGYRRERLSFSLFLHSCYSGKLKSLLRTNLPFATLVFASSAPEHTALTYVFDEVLRRTNVVFAAGAKTGVELCPSCRHQEIVYLLMKYVSRSDLYNGSDALGTGLPGPDLDWISGGPGDPEAHLPELAHNLLEIYAKSLDFRKGLAPFRQVFEFAIESDKHRTMLDAFERILNQLSPEVRAAYDSLRLLTRYDDLSPPEIEMLFQRLGKSAEAPVRESATDTLLTFGEIMEPDEADRRILRQIDFELGQPEPNLLSVEKLKVWLKTFNSPRYPEACEKLLTADWAYRF